MLLVVRDVRVGVSPVFKSVLTSAITVGFIAAAELLPAMPMSATAAETLVPRPAAHLSDLYAASAPALPPIGYSQFCSRYPEDCAVQKTDFRRRNIRLTVARWDELNTVNRQVNRDIVSESTNGDITNGEWRIYPLAGDCKDYVATKRHELLARGWPSRVLLTAEVVAPSGEHHVVLVVRTKNVDLVLDNLNANIRSVAMTYRQYQWVRIETPQNPKLWRRLQTLRTVDTSN